MLKPLLLWSLLLGLSTIAAADPGEPLLAARWHPAPLQSAEAEVPAAPGAPASLDDVAGLTAFFDGAMHVGMQEHHITGAVVAIVKGGQVLFSKGYGESNLARGTPIDPATSLFRIGSVTKTFTWTAVMQLVEEGKLDLDKDVNTYLKGVQIPRTYAKPVTMRTLMTHTAGFEDGAVGYLIKKDPRAQLSILEAMRRHMPRRVRPPGEMFAYSNYGAALAGLIVQQVSGIPYNDYIEQKIFAPLGMRYATVAEPVPRQLAPYVTTAYELKQGAEVPQPYEILGGFRAAGGAAVSALDMTHFMIAHLQDGQLEGHQILKPQTAQQMHATDFKLDERFPGMALGFYHEDVNGNDAYAHAGDTLFYHTDMVLLPKQNVGLFLSFIGVDRQIREEIEDAFFARYFPDTRARPPRLPDSQARQLLWRYTGTYEWTRRNFSDIDKLLSLFQQVRVSGLPNGNLLVSGLAQEPLQFEPIADDLYREVLRGELKIAFRTDSRMRAPNIFLDGYPFMPTERVPWYEESFTWFSALGVVFLVFLGVLASTYYRWREIRAMEPRQQLAIWSAVTVAAWAFATMIVLGSVIAIAGEDTLIGEIPIALTVGLALPVIFAVLTAWQIMVTGRVWLSGFWTLGRRVGYSVTALAALILNLFFWHWNLLGWRYG